jgi:hypothetical protein
MQRLASNQLHTTILTLSLSTLFQKNGYINNQKSSSGDVDLKTAYTIRDVIIDAVQIYDRNCLSQF